MANTLTVTNDTSNLAFTEEPTTLTLDQVSSVLEITDNLCPITTITSDNILNVIQSEINLEVLLNTPTVSVNNVTTTISVDQTNVEIIEECKQGPQGPPGTGSDQDQVAVSSTDTTIISCVNPNVAWSVQWMVVIESPNDDLSRNMVVSAIYNTGNLLGGPCWTTSNINGNVIPGQIDVVLDAGLICLRFRNDHTLGVKVTALKLPLNRF